MQQIVVDFVLVAEFAVHPPVEGAASILVAAVFVSPLEVRFDVVHIEGLKEEGKRD